MVSRSVDPSASQEGGEAVPGRLERSLCRRQRHTVKLPQEPAHLNEPKRDEGLRLAAAPHSQTAHWGLWS